MPKSPDIKIPLRNQLFILFLCGYSLLTAGNAFAQDLKIFILHSYHQEYQWTSNENKGFIQTLTNTLPVGNASFSTEYLDTKRHEFDQEYQEFFFLYLKQKYSHYLPDVIFSTDDNALTFLMHFKERLFGDTPIVFCGVNNLDVEKELYRQEYTGVFEKKEIAPNLSFLQNLNLDSGNIIIFGDNSSTHQAIVQSIRIDIASQNPTQEYTVLSSDNLTFLISQLKSIKEGIIFLTTIGGIKDEQAAVVPLQKTLSSIVNAGNFTIISMEDAYLEKGVLGGYMTSGFSQGKDAANLAIQILQGNSPASIPLITESPNEWIFNYPQLKKIGVSSSKLPEKSVILNRPLSYYDQYKYRIWLVVFFIILLVAAIIALVQNIQKRKKAEMFLQKARGELEQKVTERTAELSKANADLNNEITERKHTELALMQSEARLQSILSAAPTGIGVVIDRVLVEVNDHICEMIGRTEDELLGKSARILYPTQEEFEKVGREKYFQITEHGTGTVETLWLRKDGLILNVLLSSSPINPDDLSVGVTFTATDITNRKIAEKEKIQLEVKLQKAYKMDAIGTLAGGIAHDFNNLLTIILGYAELIKSDATNTSLVQEGVTQVRIAADRAKHLVTQILAFSRDGEHDLMPIKLQYIVKETLKLLRSTIPTTIEIKQDIYPQCGVVNADPTQINQIVINLCINAVHAMDEKGVLSVTLEEVNLKAQALTHQPEMSPGSYVCLSVSDTGDGMDQETIDRIFEPFYTTKEVGKGTGMGLSVVHGIVESHGGYINVESELGRGSTFKIYFPVTEEEEFIGVATSAQPDTGIERILLVDDETMILEMAEQMLVSLGYKVMIENNSVKALEIFKSDPDQFDLVITDQAMPDMSGAELIAEILQIKPDIPIIFCTGYSSKVSSENASEKGISKYMTKPYRPKELAKAIREVLNGKL